jgi:hypothetical protein
MRDAAIQPSTTARRAGNYDDTGTAVAPGLTGASAATAAPGVRRTVAAARSPRAAGATTAAASYTDIVITIA